MINTYLKNKSLLLFVIIYLISVFSVPVNGSENKWQLEKEEDDIQVYVAQTKGSAVKAFRGIVTVDSSLETVLSVIGDASTYPHWLHNCKSAKTIKRVNKNEIYNHIVTNMPWPVADRDSVVYSLMSLDESTNKVTIDFSARPQMLEKLPRTVRIKDVEGKWQLTPLDNGQIKILYQMSVDPGGNIPKWLVNSLAVDIPFHTLRKLRSFSQKI